MTHFSHDYEQGIKDERERIITLLEDLAAGQEKVIIVSSLNRFVKQVLLR